MDASIILQTELLCGNTQLRILIYNNNYWLLIRDLDKSPFTKCVLLALISAYSMDVR